MTSRLHTGDCSSRLQDSELDVLRVRVGVLEGALRDVADVAAEVEAWHDEAHHMCDRGTGELAEAVAAARAVLAGGEAAGQGEEES